MKNLKARASRLRRLGWSYNIIARRLGVAKSTLSHWLRTVPYEPNEQVIKRIRAGPAKSAAVRNRAKLIEIASLHSSALREIGRISHRDLWFLGLGLYMGDGSKLYERVCIINSDPNIVRLAMRWLRDICRVPTRNFSVAVHLYPDVTPERAVAYWSGVTGIPRSQFEKVQVDRRTGKSERKHRFLPFGTAHIKIRSRGNRQFGVTLHRRIMSWMEGVCEKLRA